MSDFKVDPEHFKLSGYTNFVGLFETAIIFVLAYSVLDHRWLIVGISAASLFVVEFWHGKSLAADFERHIKEFYVVKGTENPENRS